MGFSHSIRNLPKTPHVLTLVQKLKNKLILDVDSVVVILENWHGWSEGAGEMLVNGHKIHS